MWEIGFNSKTRSRKRGPTKTSLRDLERELKLKQEKVQKLQECVNSLTKKTEELVLDESDLEEYDDLLSSDSDIDEESDAPNAFRMNTNSSLQNSHGVLMAKPTVTSHPDNSQVATPRGNDILPETNATAFTDFTTQTTEPSHLMEFTIRKGSGHTSESLDGSNDSLSPTEQHSEAAYGKTIRCLQFQWP